jgi:hypothetical protein
MTYSIKPLDWEQLDEDGPEVARGVNGYVYAVDDTPENWRLRVTRNGTEVFSTVGFARKCLATDRAAQHHEQKLAAYLTPVG